ncbi:MAG: GAF domain-containing protein [Aeromonas salmonicida]
MRYPEFPVPADEIQRQDTLASYGVLDTPSDEHLDRLVRLAAKLIHAPIALISLIDAKRQWFLARHGLEITETPRHMAFCAHAISSDKPLIIADAQLDPRFRTNPLVTSEPYIRFYAGVPLKAQNGHNLGTLCILDRMPRHFTNSQESLLHDLAQLVLRELELRRLSDSPAGAKKRDIRVQAGTPA